MLKALLANIVYMIADKALVKPLLNQYRWFK